MSEQEQITKDVTIVKLYDSNTDADLEAQQFTMFDGMLNRMTPAPRTWNVQARVTKAEVFKTDDPRGKARVKLTVAATGSESRIDAWVEEYTKLHGRLAEAGDATRVALNEAAAKKRAQQ
jgi:hypothetical protein